MNERVDRASRLIHASSRDVFEGFSTEDALTTWLPPGGMECQVLAFTNVPRGIRPEDHEVGLAASLGNLAAFVEGRRSSITRLSKSGEVIRQWIEGGPRR